MKIPENVWLTAVAEGQRREYEERCRLPDELVHDPAEGGPYQDPESESTKCDAHRVSSLLVVRVTLGQHSHAGYAGAGRSDSLECPRYEQNAVAPTECEYWKDTHFRLVTWSILIGESESDLTGGEKSPRDYSSKGVVFYFVYGAPPLVSQPTPISAASGSDLIRTTYTWNYHKAPSDVRPFALTNLSTARVSNQDAFFDGLETPRFKCTTLSLFTQNRELPRSWKGVQFLN